MAQSPWVERAASSRVNTLFNKLGRPVLTFPDINLLVKVVSRRLLKICRTKRHTQLIFHFITVSGSNPRYLPCANSLLEAQLINTFSWPVTQMDTENGLDGICRCLAFCTYRGGIPWRAFSLTIRGIDDFPEHKVSASSFLFLLTVFYGRVVYFVDLCRQELSCC